MTILVLKAKAHRGLVAYGIPDKLRALQREVLEWAKDRSELTPFCELTGYIDSYACLRVKLGLIDDSLLIDFQLCFADFDTGLVE